MQECFCFRVLLGLHEHCRQLSVLQHIPCTAQRHVGSARGLPGQGPCEEGVVGDRAKECMNDPENMFTVSRVPAS